MIRRPRTKFADEGALDYVQLFFELQEKYFSLELANLMLSQETKTLSSGNISFRGVLIQVKYSRLSLFLAGYEHHTVLVERRE